MWGDPVPGLADKMLADPDSFTFIDPKADSRFTAALTAAMGTVASVWETETLFVTITGGARAAWILNDWPMHDPLHWRMVLAGRLGKSGQDLRSVRLHEEGEQGIVVELRVSRGEADTVLRTLGQTYPDLDFSYTDFRRPAPVDSLWT